MSAKVVSYNDTEERDLLALVKTGDYSAFKTIYNKYWSILYASAYNVLRDKDSSMDIVQEIFIWFWEHRLNWTLTSCKGYLLTAVKFKVANYIRNDKVRSTFFDQLADLQEVVADDINLMIEVAELRQFIDTFINDLPEKCREIFHLSRVGQLSNREIAEKLGISEKTVANQINTALNKLRKRLGSSNYLLLLLF
ncbi:RNA polymerase sigma-70 factor [Pedobacter sp. MC2016-14]|uniref:RNA polymerase sigma-70 factor n=1 Tax=Pedobacter sp. MC2016-14 TaxID=2897327 RepID=UPI001E6592D7|nr:RNA polymerase sigma-70 factor [Pedobacter sp. MC2016-14]MCD0486701.1 RNA polymerase sigma-70 factor [Pedobacter sp. MC2016-14]